MDLLVFGTGRFYENRKFILDMNHDRIVSFIDNRAKEIGTFEGKHVFLPSQVSSLSYDIILLMSADSDGMLRQLLDLGIDGSRMWEWERYLGEKGRGKFFLHLPKKVDILATNEKRVGIVTTMLDYNGASVAILYGALALQRKGYGVTLVTYEADKCFLEEVLLAGIRVVIASGINWMHKEELDWLCMFDLLIVNTFQMVRTACMVSEYRPVVWWIHEPDGKHENIYAKIQYKFTQDARNIIGRKMLVYAVSNIAASNFETYYPERVCGLLQYGIPDTAVSDTNVQGVSKKFVFAIVGGVVQRKAQGIFLSAVKLLPKDLLGKACFWIIGGIGDSDYGLEVSQMAAQLPQVSIIGQLSRSEMEKAFSDIDSLVCPSLEDPLPIVVTEGWMHSKVCIMSDATGQADMTEDGVNGLVCKAGDVQALADKMAWVLENRDKLDGIRQKGRETYEKYFSMESFGERLEQALQAAERKFHKQKD